MSHVVIVAGGLGSRLAPLTNHIPKFLVNIGKNTGYVEQVRYWLQYGGFEVLEGDFQDMEPPRTITVIVHSAYEELVTAYHKLYFKNIPLTVKTVDVANGSAHAILSSCKHLTGRDVFFQWCDIIPGEMIDEVSERHGGKTVIFTNYDHPNRYGLVRVGSGWANIRPVLQEDGRGGVFGLYHVSNFSTDIEYQNGQDFVEVLHQYGEMREHELKSIVDFGDKPKLERTRDLSDAAREFNQLEFHGELVLKSAINEQGSTLAEREIGWYKKLDSLKWYKKNHPRVPQIWTANDNSSFVMSRVKGVPVYQIWPTLDAEGRALVLNRVLEQLRLLHAVDDEDVSTEDFVRDVKIEAHNKLLARYTEIKDVITAFGAVQRVNTRRLLHTSPENLITDLYQELVHQYQGNQKYNVIHGDLQFSNSMINPDTLEVTLIDPRGYFGKTQFYGLADYDIAKLLYSLTGYDLFNYSREFHITRTPDKVLMFDIPTPELDGTYDIIKETFKYRHYLWLAVIWIGLAGYIKNDPVKSLAAHYHGLKLAEQVLAGELCDKEN